MPANLIGIFGIVVILAIAVAFSSNRKAIHLRVVGAAFALQAVIAAIVLYWSGGQRAINALSQGVLAVIDFANAGINMSGFLSRRHPSSFPSAGPHKSAGIGHHWDSRNSG